MWKIDMERVGSQSIPEAVKRRPDNAGLSNIFFTTSFFFLVVDSVQYFIKCRIWYIVASQAKDVASAGPGRFGVTKPNRPVHNAPGPSGTVPDIEISWR